MKSLLLVFVLMLSFSAFAQTGEVLDSATANTVSPKTDCDCDDKTVADCDRSDCPVNKQDPVYKAEDTKSSKTTGQ